MKSVLVSLTIAIAGAVLLVVFNLAVTDSERSLAREQPADDPGTSVPGQTQSTPALAPRLTSEPRRTVDPVAKKQLDRAIQHVDDAEASYALIDRELKTLEAEMAVLGSGTDEFVAENFLIQADPLLDRLIAAEEAVQQAKNAERAARTAAGGG